MSMDTLMPGSNRPSSPQLVLVSHQLHPRPQVTILCSIKLNRPVNPMWERPCPPVIHLFHDRSDGQLFHRLIKETLYPPLCRKSKPLVVSHDVISIPKRGPPLVGLTKCDCIITLYQIGQVDVLQRRQVIGDTLPQVPEDKSMLLSVSSSRKPETCSRTAMSATSVVVASANSNSISAGG
jgi:hypothetical protein